MLIATLNGAAQETRTQYSLRYRLACTRAGSVWEAENDYGEEVALKFINCDDGLTASTLVWSLQALRSLAHPHLVHIDEVIYHYGCVVVVMELADASLRDVVHSNLSRHQRPLTPQQVCAYLTEAAEAIDFLNGRGANGTGPRSAIQHGSVRPSNLLLFGDTVKLADCGPVWPTGVPLKLRQRGDTLVYAAPEVFHGRLSDWTDQYALAVSYCEVRGGRLPFTDTPERLQRSYLRPEPDLSMLSEKERPILRRALAPLPLDRWPSCTALMQRLEEVVR